MDDFTHQFHVNTLSHMAKQKEVGLILRNIQTAIIPDAEQVQRGVGHGMFLKEQGFYPLNHRGGVIILSYHDPLQGAVIYEKLLCVKAVPTEQVKQGKIELEDGERMISFE